MHPETKATILASALLGTLTIMLWWMGMPYVIQSPGPTFNVLGDNSAGQPVIQVAGAKQYDDSGTLRMVTVSSTRPDAKVSLPESIYSWLSPGDELIPYSAYYGPSTTQSDEVAQGMVEMVTSQDSAVAAALTQLGYKYTTRVGIAYVDPKGPSGGILQAKDVIESIDGTTIKKAKQLVDIITAHKPGDKITVQYQREQLKGSVVITLGASPDKPSEAFMGVYLGTSYQFPITVNVNVNPNIGGPSAGLVLSLAIYDKLTPGSLVGDVPIAGTGTITPNGTVGEIGGIQQKIRAASEAGAKLFLVPPGNCAEALGADPVRPITLVKAPTMVSALHSIEAYVADPNTSLPGCTS